MASRKVTRMNWLTWIVIGGAITAFLVLKRLALVRPEVARDCLKRGAKVIDVRSEAEFQEKHLPAALNIPLDRLRDHIGRHAPDLVIAVEIHEGKPLVIQQGNLPLAVESYELFRRIATDSMTMLDLHPAGSGTPTSSNP